MTEVNLPEIDLLVFRIGYPDINCDVMKHIGAVFVRLLEWYMFMMLFGAPVQTLLLRHSWFMTKANKL